MDLRNDKKLIFNHRCILKEMAVFVNKVENKQKTNKSPGTLA
jgi:hypothetical protein